MIINIFILLIQLLLTIESFALFEESYNQIIICLLLLLFNLYKTGFKGFIAIYTRYAWPIFMSILIFGILGGFASLKLLFKLVYFIEGYRFLVYVQNINTLQANPNYKNCIFLILPILQVLLLENSEGVIKADFTSTSYFLAAIAFTKRSYILFIAALIVALTDGGRILLLALPVIYLLAVFPFCKIFGFLKYILMIVISLFLLLPVFWSEYFGYFVAELVNDPSRLKSIPYFLSDIKNCLMSGCDILQQKQVFIADAGVLGGIYGFGFVYILVYVALLTHLGKTSENDLASSILIVCLIVCGVFYTIPIYSQSFCWYIALALSYRNIKKPSLMLI